MRLVLFTGKGGVGKTTVAAATAVHAAQGGVKTLVVSTDAAHSLGDALGIELGPQPQGVADGLFAQQIDPRVSGEQSWREVQAYLRTVLEALGVDPVAADELTVLPGVEEILALLELRDQVREGPWDLVVVDCAPTAETLRLLALPEALGRYVERMLPVERTMLRALAGGARPRGIPLPDEHVVAAAARLHLELTGAREVLAAPGTSVRLVFTPESVVLAEARRAWTALALYGYGVDAVVANRLVPGGRDRWRAGWAQAQALLLAEAEASFAPVPVLRAGYAPAEPVGIPALVEFGAALYGAPGPAAAQRMLREGAAAAPLRVERSGDRFSLVLQLPLADRREVDLARRGDDLTIRVGGLRRVLSLPSVLRRCRVLGASLRDGRLQVDFEPDPQLWRTV